MKRLTNPLAVGTIAAVLLALSSHGAGATRNRGGFMDFVGLGGLTYGHGSSLMSVVFSISLFVFVASWAWLGREVLAAKHDESSLFTHIVSWCAPFLIAAPILSRDVYSYLMQGAMVRDGFDPYTEGAAVNPGPFLLEVSHDWRNTTTPYGPLHLWIGEVVTRIVGDSVAGGIILYKAISVLGFLGIVWAVPRIARRLGGDSTLALWLGVANPVMILHMIGGMHNESVMVGLVSIGIVLCLDRRFVAGVALIAVAASLKATAAIALPFIVWMATFHYAGKDARRGRIIAYFFATTAAGIFITLTIVAAVTWLSGSSWGWLSQITGNSKVVNPLALPTLMADVLVPFFQVFNPHFDYNLALMVTRGLMKIMMAVGLVLVWWTFRGGDRRSVMGSTAAYFVAFICNSVTLPWYYASIISLLGTFTPPRWLIQVGTGASVFIALAFTGTGNHQLYSVSWVVISLLVAWAASSAIMRGEAKKPSPEPVE